MEYAGRAWLASCFRFEFARVVMNNKQVLMSVVCLHAFAVEVVVLDGGYERERGDMRRR